jgi:hypothetical protein
LRPILRSARRRGTCRLVWEVKAGHYPALQLLVLSSCISASHLTLSPLRITSSPPWRTRTRRARALQPRILLDSLGYRHLRWVCRACCSCRRTVKQVGLRPGVCEMMPWVCGVKRRRLERARASTSTRLQACQMLRLRRWGTGSASRGSGCRGTSTGGGVAARR